MWHRKVSKGLQTRHPRHGCSARAVCLSRAKAKPQAREARTRKELDATEKVINSFAGLKGLLADEETFMNVTFQKCTAMSQKIEARNSPELQKVYRHLAAEEQCEKAVNIMRDIAEAVHQVELWPSLWRP